MDDEFKKHYGSVHAYLEQYIKTATKGNVEVTYALHVSRLRLNCKVCQEQLTAPDLVETEVSYSIQEFVKIHAHTGGHKDAPVGHVVGQGGECWCGEKHADYVKPVTFDFKPVTTGDFNPVTGGFGFQSLPLTAKSVLQGIHAASAISGGDVIDLKASMAAKIEGQIKTFDKEFADKMSDANLAAKIAALQQTDYSGELAKGLADLKAKGLLSPGATNVAQEKIADSKAELQALQNILTLKAMEKKKQQLLGALSGEHPVKIAVKKEKPLRISTGRKFR